MTDPARWISVGELAEAFSPDSNTPPHTDALAGATHTLDFEDGRVAEYRFLSDSRLAWSEAGGEGGGPGDPGRPRRAEGEAGYFALEPRDGIYFVDFVAADEPPTAVSLVLDLPRGIATELVARLPQAADVGESLMARIARGSELTAVAAGFSSAAIDAPFTASTPRHEPTADLVGRRVEYTYSATERYEHIYLNEHFYTWHCLLGSEKGLADTDRCHYLKLGDDLYLFVWREKIVPTLGAVVVDFRAMRTVGKIFGHAAAGSAPAEDGLSGAPAGVVDFPVGARAAVVNITDRSGAIWP